MKWTPEHQICVEDNIVDVHVPLMQKKKLTSGIKCAQRNVHLVDLLNCQLTVSRELQPVK